MKLAADFRQEARLALKGRWSVAVIAGLLASILGATSGVPSINIHFEENEFRFESEIGQLFNRWTVELPSQLMGALIGLVSFAVLTGLVFGIAYFVLGSIIRVGYAQFNLTLLEREREPEIGALFGYFKHWKTLALTGLLEGLYVFLWSLLFVIPGIIAAYNYAMVPYILTQEPQLPPREALARSKEMMRGNRWRLFCLHCSFLGWALLCVLTLGIGSLWLTPYTQAASAAFYKEISLYSDERPWENT